MSVRIAVADMVGDTGKLGMRNGYTRTVWKDLFTLGFTHPNELPAI